MKVRWSTVLAGLLMAAFVAGCGARPTSPPQATVAPGTGNDPDPASPASILPGSGEVPGWEPSDEATTYFSDNLYDLVNGQADAFFAYGFEQVAVGNYQNAEGASLRVEVWQVSTPSDAYGLFSSLRSGNPVSVATGSGETREGDADPGRRLDFWQDRYLVRLFAPMELDDTDLTAFAMAVAGALPGGGESPDLLRQLPLDGLVPHSDLFFHQEISLQSYLWLGGENVLGLGTDTDGIWARYEVGSGTAQLLLVHYPSATAAEAALDALQASAIDSLVRAEARGDLLGALFGAISEAEADLLLDEALATE